MIEELRKAEQAQKLLLELERRLLAAGDQAELERYLRQLEQVDQSLPEADPIRLLIEDAVGSARTRDAIKAGSEVSKRRPGRTRTSPLITIPAHEPAHQRPRKPLLCGGEGRPPFLGVRS